MNAVSTGFSYFVAGLLGLVMAFLPTAVISWIILPPDGPVGEGLLIMLIYILCSIACIPGYVALMALHREKQRDTRILIACEVGLRLSMSVAGGFLCFMAIKLPTSASTKFIFCLLAALTLAWSLNPRTWSQDLQQIG